MSSTTATVPCTSIYSAALPDVERRLDEIRKRNAEDRKKLVEDFPNVDLAELDEEFKSIPIVRLPFIQYMPYTAYNYYVDKTTSSRGTIRKIKASSCYQRKIRDNETKLQEFKNKYESAKDKYIVKERKAEVGFKNPSITDVSVARKARA